MIATYIHVSSINRASEVCQVMGFGAVCSVGQQWRGRKGIVSYQRSRSPVTLALVGMCSSACLSLSIYYFVKSSSILVKMWFLV